MAMDQPLAERVLFAFLTHMMRADAIDPADISDAADRLERDGDTEAAHAMRCMIVQASTPEQSDWEADRARARFHAIDGGKSPD